MIILLGRKPEKISLSTTWTFGEIVKVLISFDMNLKAAFVRGTLWLAFTRLTNKSSDMISTWHSFPPSVIRLKDGSLGYRRRVTSVDGSKYLFSWSTSTNRGVTNCAVFEPVTSARRFLWG